MTRMLAAEKPAGDSDFTFDFRCRKESLVDSRHGLNGRNIDQSGCVLSGTNGSVVGVQHRRVVAAPTEGHPVGGRHQPSYTELPPVCLRVGVPTRI